MSRVSVPLSLDGFGSYMAEANGDVDVRKGCCVIAGTAQNQVKPVAYDASAQLTTIIGVAQEDADAGEPVRIALPGQIGIVRTVGAPAINEYLEAGAGSATDAENGMLGIYAPATGQLTVARALEAGTAKSYIKAAIMCILFP